MSTSPVVVQTFEPGFGTFNASFQNPNEPQLIKFGEGITPADVQFKVTTSAGYGSSSLGPPYSESLSWEITLAGTGDVIKAGYVGGFGNGSRDGQPLFLPVLPSSPLNLPGLIGFEFADGTFWSHDKVLSFLQDGANVSGPMVQGSSNADLILGDSRDHELRGFEGNDTLVSGTGNERLAGYEGTDVYRFLPGWGRDIVRFDAQDVVEFGAGIAPADIQHFRVAGDLYLRDLRTGSTARLASYFLNLSTAEHVDVRFSDGTEWRTGSLALTPTAYADCLDATSESTLLNGLGGADVLQGDEGNDTLLGGSGDDTLDGGAGSNRIEGGAGVDRMTGGRDDTFVFGSGFGRDTVTVNGGATLQFVDGIKSSDVRIQDLAGTGPDGWRAPFRIILKSTGESVDFRYGQGTGYPPVLADLKLVFADGVVWTGADLPHPATPDGSWSNPGISGANGADTLTATQEFTVLSGGAGSDTYRVGTNTTITLGGNTVGDVDTIVLGQGIKPEDVVITTPRLNYRDRLYKQIDGSYLAVGVAAGQNDLLIDTGTSQGVVRISSGTVNPLGQVRLAFADGTVWSAAELEERAHRGSARSEIIVADPLRAEVFTLGIGGGHDTLIGLSPDDTVKLATDQVVFTTSTESAYGGITSSRYGSTTYTNVVPSVMVTFLATGETAKLYDVSLEATTPFIELPDGRKLSGSELLDFSAAPHAVGTMGGDVLLGTERADLILGLSGDDTLLGHGGQDTLKGGLGNDVLEGGRGDDVLVGGPGWTTVVYNAGDGQDRYLLDPTLDHVLRLGAGIAPADVQFIPAGQVYRSDNYVDQYRIGFKGRDGDGLSGDGWFSSVVFADGTVWGLEQIRQSVPTVPQVGIEGTDGPDALHGTAGADDILGRYGDDTLYGEQGDDTLSGGYGRNLLYGNDGNDLLYGDDSTDTLVGGLGDDTLRGYTTAVVLFNKGDGHDTIQGLRGAIKLGPGLTQADLVIGAYVYATDEVTLSFKNSTDTIKVLGLRSLSDGSSVVFDEGGALNFYQIEAEATRAGLAVTGTGHSDTIIGGSGPDTLLGAGGSDSLYGAGGNDWLEGGAGNDVLTGGGYRDTLIGGEGNDVLVYAGDGGHVNGGTGNDLFILGAWNTVAHFHAGSGQDTLTGNANVVVEFDESVDPTGFTLSPIGTSFLLSNPSSTDSILFLPEGDGVPATLPSIRFADGSHFEGTVLRGVNLQGTPQADALTGSWRDDSLAGMAGDDVIAAGLGNDTLVGGRGQDTLTGGAGVDTFVFNAGDGQDVIHADAQDQIVLGAGLSADSFEARYLPDLEDTVVIRWGGDSLRIDQAHTLGDLPLAFAGQHNLSLTTILAQADLVSGRLLQGTDGDDFIQDSWGRDTLIGGAGNDFMTGSQGANLLLGQDGNDTLAGWSQAMGGDTLIGGAGNDVLRMLSVEGQQMVQSLFSPGFGQDSLKCFGTGRNVVRFEGGILPSDIGLSRSQGDLILTRKGSTDVLKGEEYFDLDDRVFSVQFADGTVWGKQQIIDILAAPQGVVLNGTAEADRLDGGVGNDTLLGMAGNDTLVGGLGDDRFVFNAGFGQDTIVGSAQADADVMAFGPGIKLSDLRQSELVGKPGVRISVAGSSDWVDVPYVLLSAGGDTRSPVASVEVAGQAALSWSGFLQQVPKAVVNLSLTGAAGKDKLTGQAGNDTLTGLAGNDTLAGGLGNDLLIGGKGADTYVFNRGDGQDTIVENDTSLLNTLLSPDLLKIGSVKANQLWLSKSGNNLDIAIIGTTDKVTIQDWYKGSAYQVEKITALGDNKSLSASKVNALVNAMAKFTAPADGVTTLPAATQTSLNKILASSWS